MRLRISLIFTNKGIITRAEEKGFDSLNWYSKIYKICQNRKEENFQLTLLLLKHVV